MMKKILVTFLFTLMFFVGSVSEALAQETSSAWMATPNSLEDAFNKKSPALENLTVFNGSSIVAQLSVMTVGLPPKNSQGQTRTPQERGGGLVGTMGNLSLAMTQQPGGTSTKEYIADLGHDLGVVPKEALAQGTGFSSLSPILIIWKTTRDAVYLFYVVIFMVVGFMILLRKKIDPRTVITIEAALPRLIIGLILVTFSYAIISFMVDLANLATRVIAFLFFKKILFTDDASYTYALQNIFNANIFQLSRPIGDVYKIVDQVGQILDPNKFDIGVEFVKGLIQGATLLVFGFAVLFITFKIFFSLLGPYVGIVLAVILSPFEILMTALPGSEATLTNWLKNILFFLLFFLCCFLPQLLEHTTPVFVRMDLALSGIKINLFNLRFKIFL